MTICLAYFLSTSQNIDSIINAGICKAYISMQFYTEMETCSSISWGIECWLDKVWQLNIAAVIFRLHKKQLNTFLFIFHRGLTPCLTLTRAPPGERLLPP